MPIWAPRGGKTGWSPTATAPAPGRRSSATLHTGAGAGDQPRSGSPVARGRGTARTAAPASVAGSGAAPSAAGDRSRPAAGPPRDRPGLAAALPGRVAAGHAVSRRCGARQTPSGMVAAAKPASWDRSSRSGANPARRIEASRWRPNSAIVHRGRDGDAGDRIGPDQGVAGGQFARPVRGCGPGWCGPWPGSSPRPGPATFRPCRRPIRRFGPAGPPTVAGRIGNTTTMERRSPGSVGVSTGANAPITAPRAGSFNGGRDRMPGVVGVVPDRLLGAGRPGLRPRHVGVDRLAGARGRPSAATMPARSPGANPVRTAAANCGEVSQVTSLHPHPGPQVALDLRHQHLHRPGPAIDAAAELLGPPRQADAPAPRSSRTPRCGHWPATTCRPCRRSPAGPAPGPPAGWWLASHCGPFRAVIGHRTDLQDQLRDQLGAGAGVQQRGQAATLAVPLGLVGQRQPGMADRGGRRPHPGRPGPG